MFHVHTASLGCQGSVRQGLCPWLPQHTMNPTPTALPVGGGPTGGYRDLFVFFFLLHHELIIVFLFLVTSRFTLPFAFLCHFAFTGCVLLFLFNAIELMFLFYCLGVMLMLKHIVH